MKYKPEDARNRVCCILQRKCEADKCMAWRWHLSTVQHNSNEKQAEYGFCGMVIKG